MDINKIRKKRIKEAKKKFKQIQKEKRKEKKEDQKQNPLNKLIQANLSLEKEIQFLEKEREKLEKDYDLNKKEMRNLIGKSYFEPKNQEIIIKKEILLSKAKKIDLKIERLTDEINKRIRNFNQL